MRPRVYNITPILSIAFLLHATVVSSQILCGADQTDKYFPLLKNKTIAVVANPASLVGKVNLVDTLYRSGIRVARIFSPEHGFRSFEEAGQFLKNGMDSATGIPVVSLYGKKMKPDKADLQEVDLVLFDLQDVGVRCFTYLSTLSYVMEACAENNVQLLLLDRPNPNGFYIDGPVTDSAHFSYVGLHPVPLVYGMTLGEYAGMVNGEGWLKNGMICELEVVPLKNYAHSSLYQLPCKPSPNLPDMNAVYLYPSLVLFEGTIVSVGRGTEMPFEVFGHPGMKGFAFSFTPKSIKGMSQNPPYKGQLCRGLDLRDFYKTHPKMFGRINLSWLNMAYIDLSSPSFFNDYFDKLVGNSILREQIRELQPESRIRLSWQEDLNKFREIRKRYLLYPE
ncbi:MAG TPA: DUF1343 domain-containing protein [Bacteroidales bacterium]|nr:DUF1343 domain-containing protein [Bacteroidales bacterium]